MQARQGNRNKRGGKVRPSALKALERRIDQAFGYEFNTPRARRRALWHFYFIDHAILRGLWTNLEEFAPGAWRSNQPSPRRISRYARMGIRTVLNLRGESRRSNYRFEEAACRRHGIKLVSVRMKARQAVPRATLLELLDIFDSIEKPFVLHCKSGADRAGFASALYLLHVEGRSVAEARRMLSLRYLHVERFRTGILGFILDRYAADCAREPMSIRDWIATRYNYKKLNAEFAQLRGYDTADG